MTILHFLNDYGAGNIHYCGMYAYIGQDLSICEPMAMARTRCEPCKMFDVEISS